MGGGDAGAPKKGGAGKKIAIGCVVLLLLSCCCFSGYWFVYPAFLTYRARSAAAGMSGGDIPVSAGGGEASGVCAKAKACCTAYVAALGPAGASAAAACTALDQTAQAGAAAEPACQSAIDSWKQSLTAMGKPIPSECN